MTEADKIHHCRKLVLDYFKGDHKRAQIWWNVPNPLLGKTIPNNMIKRGRVNKLLAMIENALAGITP